MSQPLSQHDKEIQENIRCWNSKPLLREIYGSFYREIAKHTRPDIPGLTVEVGSGIGSIKDYLPSCLRTDLFANPWLDRQENAYELSFGNQEVANLILFDVFHHLRYPGTAFEQFARVLAPGGRLIVFEPCLSLLGLLVYGVFHHEPLGLLETLPWSAPPGWSPQADTYYAAQGNAYRHFFGHRWTSSDFKLIARARLSCLSYVASGGYRGPQLYPDRAYPLMKKLDRLGDLFPTVFATRLLVALERLPIAGATADSLPPGEPEPD